MDYFRYNGELNELFLTNKSQDWNALSLFYIIIKTAIT